ncbi:hypothetical protein FRC07_006159 [Ceratobasidium sp. 392]|nr:hypothetical protein FRC07_006159 [Ceratobasidium sp. 392]
MTDTNASRVFHCPELLSNICCYSEKPTLLSLVRTSRSAFDGAVPQIWESLGSVQPLLMLLAFKRGLITKSSERLQIVLPSSSSETFARFDLYAPSVQQLIISKWWKINREEYLPFWMSSWKTLAHRAQSSPLLPNLRELTFDRSPRFGDEMMLWLSAFVPPTLRTLKVLGSADLKNSNLVNILGLLAYKSPRLETLRLDPSFSFSSIGIGEAPEEDLLQMIYSPVVGVHLQNLQNLTLLAVRGTFINPETLAAISHLRNLKQLYIGNCGPGYQPDLPNTFRMTQLSNDPFFALVTLTLNTAQLDSILAAWECVPLVQNLRTVRLVHWPYELNNEVPIYDDTVLRRLLPTISENSPRVENMYLDGGLSAYAQVEVSSRSWDAIARLPLRYLELGKFDANVSFFRNCFPVLHDLETFVLPNQILTLEHLVQFGRLTPHLRQLHSNLASPLHEIPQTQPEGALLLRTITLVESLGERVSIQSPEKIARFLLLVWPNLQEIKYVNNAAEDQLGLELLNLRLQFAQGVAKTKKNISAHFGSDTIPLLLDRIIQRRTTYTILERSTVGGARALGTTSSGQVGDAWHVPASGESTTGVLNFASAKNPGGGFLVVHGN